MREQHDTRLLEEMVRSASDRLQSPARQISEASARLSRQVDAAATDRVTRAEAQARSMILLAQGRRAVLVLAALSLVVMAMGAAGWLILSAMPGKQVATAPAAAPAVIRATPAWPPMPVPPAQPGEAGIVTTNYSLFRETTVAIGARDYNVVAGHQFLTETDRMFSHAWCYTRDMVDGLLLEIELGTLAPNASPVISMPTSAILRESGLSRGDITTLFNACPWLEGNPDVRAAVDADPDVDIYRFTTEVTADSVDRLVAALADGAGVVEFASPGGEVGEAVRGFAAIHAAGVATVATGDCLSACTLLFLGGAARAVAPNGRIGVHQWRSERGTTTDSDAQMAAALLISLISSAGVSQEFFIAGARMPSEGMYFLTRSELVDWGVVRPQA